MAFGTAQITGNKALLTVRIPLAAIEIVLTSRVSPTPFQTFWNLSEAEVQRPTPAASFTWSNRRAEKNLQKHVSKISLTMKPIPSYARIFKRVKLRFTKDDFTAKRKEHGILMLLTVAVKSSIEFISNQKINHMVLPCALHGPKKENTWDINSSIF